jgi:glutamate transport system substrate-binding protein
MRSTYWRLLLAAVAALSLALFVAACGGDDETETTGEGGSQTTATAEATTEVKKFEPGTTLGDIQEKGEITIGVKFDVPPFGFKNTGSGEVEGFDIDLGKAVAEALGVKPKFIEAISDNRIPFLEKGTADLILSTMTINEERVGQIDFSDPYFIAKGRILVKKDNSEITGVDTLAGKNVCTVLGSTYEATLKSQAPDAKLKLVDSYSECLELLQNDTVEAISTDDVILTGMIIQTGDELKLVGDELTQEPYGAGIKKGETEMQDFVNEVFTAYKEDGRWKETYDKWVGKYTGEDSEPPTIGVDEAVELVKQNGK